MKRILPLVFSLLSLYSLAQQKPTDLDKSPLDMSYSPQNYPILKMNGQIKTGPAIRVIYSRPQKAGREIFGGIVVYDQPWRLGANEATEIEFFKPAKINGKTVEKGRYTMFAICHPTKWTLILNGERDIWGLAYNSNKDVLHVDVPVENNNSVVEALTMYFEDRKGGTNLNIMWDTAKASLPISF